jgi:hypothetical protein
VIKATRDNSKVKLCQFQLKTMAVKRLYSLRVYVCTYEINRTGKINEYHKIRTWKIPKLFTLIFIKITICRGPTGKYFSTDVCTKVCLRNENSIKKQDPNPLKIWTGTATLENTLAFDFAKKYMLCLQKKYRLCF